jgi:lipopolysaccharide biosynthesis protein
MEPTVLWRWDRSPGGCVCLFAHYDPQGIVDPHVLYYLRELRACGMTICVISACGALAASEVDKLRGLADALIVRGNGGLDLGSRQVAMRLGLAQGFSHVLLANDSVYGPLRPLAPLLRPVLAGGFDAWGMVESREHTWHLQSWFIVMAAATLARPEVAAVLAQDFAAMTRAEVIARGELDMGRALVASGAVCGAASQAVRVPLAQRRRPVNRMHFDWYALARSGTVPFLKVELLRDNPSRIFGLARWEEALRGSSYPAELIHAHLRRVAAATSPPAEPWRQTARRRLFALLVSANRRTVLRRR